MERKVHKQLRVEELEARVAPVTLSGVNSSYTFTDASGDDVQISYAGPGSADVFWKLGGLTPNGNDDLMGINLHNTTAASKLTVKDINPGVGNDSLRPGTILNDPGKDFGTIQLITSGKIYDTNVDIWGNLTTLSAKCIQAKNLSLKVAGNLGKETIQGVLRDSHTAVGGNVSTIQANQMFNNDIKVFGNVSSIVTGILSGYGKTDVAGNLGMLKAGHVSHSDIKVGGDALKVIVNGGFYNSTFFFGGKSNSLKITGPLSKSTIMGNDIKCFSAGSMWNVTVIGQNSIGSAKVMGNLSYSRIATGGSAGLYYVKGNVKVSPSLPLALYVGQDLGKLQVKGDVENARFEVVGNLGTSQIVGTTTDMYFKVHGNLANGTFSNTMSDSKVYVVGDATKLCFKQQVTQSVVFVTGATSTLQALNGQKSAAFILQGGANKIQLSGGMEGAHLNVNGNVNQVTINGTVNNVSVIHVTGDTGLFKVTKGINGNSKVKLDGQVTTALLCGGSGTPGVDALSSVTIGSLTKTLMATGGLFGTVDITGSAAGANIKIVGNLDGSLLAGVFGNVTVQGKFNGKIGDGGTVAGTDNTLKVSQAGGAGIVQPFNAFQNYIGY